MVKKTTRKKPVKNKVHHVVRHAVVPGRHNGYRPHLTRRYGLAIVLALVIVLQFCYTQFIDGHILGDRPEITQSTLLAKTNEIRTNNNATPLAINKSLSKAALAKAQNMIENDYWAHESPDGVRAWKWINDAGYYYEEAGENLAKGFNSVDSIVDAWMGSPTHRDNVLNTEYSEAGFAVINGNLQGRDTTLVVALYAKPAATTTVLGDNSISAAPTEESNGLISRLQRGLHSSSPILIATLVLLSVVALVAILAHKYRHQLPKHKKQSLYRYHGVGKALIVAALATGLIASYGSGII